MASAAPSIGAQVGSFVVNLAANYLIGRVMAQDAPKLDNLAAAGGDYGIPMARAYGTAVRLTGSFIGQEDIRRRTHKVEDHSEIIGAIGGAVQGFMVGGPVGAVVGAAVGALLGFATPDQKYYTYDCTFGLLLTDRTDDDPIEGVLRLWANGKKIFDSSESDLLEEELDVDGKLIRRKYGKNKYLKSLTVYGGHTDQDVDPIAEDNWNETSGNVFSAYIILHELQLAFAGNSVPPVEGLVQVKTDQSLADAVEAMLAAAGVDYERDISTTALNDYTLNGYALTSETNCWDALKPLLPIFAVDAAEVSGQIRFYKRTQSMRSTFTPSDLGAYQYGDSPPEKFTFKRGDDLSLPRELSLTFVDPDRDYQPNTTTAKRSQGSAESNVDVSVPIVLSAGEGASTAELMLWDAWLGRTAVGFNLTDAWLGLATGHSYGFPFADTVLPYRITRKLRGANGIIEVEALSDESVTYTASVAGSSGIPLPDESTLFPDTRLILLDMPLTSDDHDDYGYYIAMGASEPSWTRGRIEVSGDGTNFVSIIDQPDSAVMGDVTGTLAAGTTTGLDDTLDTTTVLTVVLLHDDMELVSVTDAELDAHANFAFVGKDGLGEYLQFKTATNVSGSTWQLTNLRRGRRGTDHAIGTHTSGEEFALLGQGGVFRIVYSDTSEWGEEFTYRGVTLHQDSADADEQTFTNTGEGKRPFSPVNVEGTWDGSNNLDITWDSRSRLFAGGLGIDDNAEWDIEITSGTGRTDTVTVETWAYSAADQIIDGILPGDSIAGRVRQTSDVNDGRWRNFLLLGPDDTWELEDDLTPIHLEDGTTPLGLEA